MDKSFLDAVTKILNEFALTKFSAQVLELKGPIQEGLSYRWRLISTRYKEVTVLFSHQEALPWQGYSGVL